MRCCCAVMAEVRLVKCVGHTGVFTAAARGGSYPAFLPLSVSSPAFSRYFRAAGNFFVPRICDMLMVLVTVDCKFWLDMASAAMPCQS